MKIVRWLDNHFEEALLAILLVIIVVVSFMQVVIRKVPSIPALTWAEEFCRFCWIWSVFLSVPYTIRKGSMLRVSVLLDILPDTLHKIVNIVVEVITTLSMALLAFYSVGVVNDIRLSAETSPAMLWPMWIIYSMMLIGFSLAVIRGIQQIVIQVTHFKGGKSISTVEMAMEEAREETLLAKGGEI